MKGWAMSCGLWAMGTLNTPITPKKILSNYESI